VAFCFLLPCLAVLSVVEGREELNSPENSSDGSSPSEEEMVCSNTESEESCVANAVMDDIQDHDEFDDYDDYDEDDEDDEDDHDDEYEYDEEEDEYEYEYDEEYDEEYDDEDEDFVERISDDEDCIDEYDECREWAEHKPSECVVNPGFMMHKCKLACRVCAKHKRYSDIVPTVNGRDLGEAQTMNGDVEIGIFSEDVENRITLSQRYMNEQIQSGNIDPELLRTCKNRHRDCTFWSVQGECDKNTKYMQVHCAPACFSCDKLKLENRCPMDRELVGPDLWSPGDLDKMFRRLSSEPYKSKYDVQVLSSPDDLKSGPWVLTMENFISEEESERLIELGADSGYERSTDIGDLQPDGNYESEVSSYRTSWNSWCSDECKEDELFVAVTNRISNMTEIPLVNSEDLQLLRYTPGQYYRTHHDYIDFEVDRQQGVRIITVFLYLNDVEAGGGTNFPVLDITVTPKRGRVLIWPSVLDSDPNMEDERTLHQALPVEAGIKYGANAWLHMRNFQDPHGKSCT